MSHAGAVLARLPAEPDSRADPKAEGVDRAVDAQPRAGGSIAFEDVGKHYRSASGSVGALTGIDLAVMPGEIFGIIGRSGAGKSTLLRLINRLERPTGGRVLVDGHDIADLDEGGLVALRRRVGMVFQHFNLLSAKTVRGNVALPLLVAGVPRAERDRRVGEVLALVGLTEKSDVYPSRLSGGQKQRVGIARALVSGPEILLCDEATSALDPETTLSILALVKDINRRLGITIVLITHELSVIREVCDRVLVLERGEAVESGPVWQVFGDPRHSATQALLAPFARGLPEDLSGRITPKPLWGRTSQAIVALRFSGRREADLAGLAARPGAPVRLLVAALDRIAGHTQGRLLVSVRAAADGAIPDLSGLADDVEVLGYVADDD